MKSTQFAAHQFHNLEDAPFDPVEYSKLKFGSVKVARLFGRELADAFFAKHSDAIIANPCVVIPSPYNHVKNAATLLTEAFIDRLNDLSVNASGRHVETSIIHRKVSYIQDYGFLSKAKRKGLIDNDSFYLNTDFYKDKILIFIDDVIITGTHEDKLKEILADNDIQNETFFLYYGHYIGNDPADESRINFAAIKSIEDYLELSDEEGHQIIVRPLKYLLGQNYGDLYRLLNGISLNKLYNIYHGCIGEGYYKLPDYQTNFGLIRQVGKDRKAF